MATLLVTSLEISKTTPINGNIDVDSYAAIIEENQDFVIEKILGTRLIEKIKTDYAASSLTGHYLKIRDDYIKKILSYMVASEHILISSFQVRNGGTFRHTPQNAEPARKQEIDFLANKMSAHAQVYIERLQDYLRDNDGEIPEYTQAQDENYDIKPDKNLDTFGGLYLGMRIPKGNNAMREMYRDILYDEGEI